MEVVGISSGNRANAYQLDLASLLERPVMDVLRMVELVICMGSPASEVLEATEVLLAWLCTSALANGEAHAAASRFLREVCASYPTVALSIISSAGSVQHPKEFIAELPAILANSPSFVVEECFRELLELSESPTITVPILSAVLGTELSAANRAKVVEATHRALSILSETDFPALFRLIFVNLSIFVGTKVISKIRSEVCTVIFIIMNVCKRIPNAMRYSRTLDLLSFDRFCRCSARRELVGHRAVFLPRCEQPTTRCTAVGRSIPAVHFRSIGGANRV
jgi:hypothetical protein